MTEKAPPVSKELVEYLERIFKDRCPDVETPPNKVWFDAGAASVVRHFRKLYDQQTKQALR